MPSKTSALKPHKCKRKTGNQHNKRQTPEYWEAKLKRMGLSMNRGRSIGVEDLTYGHLIEHFGAFEGSIVFDPPTGERLDNDEWPISLC